MKPHAPTATRATTTATIQVVAPSGETLDRDAIGRVYACAFSATAEATADFIAGGFTRHQEYDGFRFFAAIDDAEQLVGFVYGYHSAPGGWWREHVRPAIEAADRARWLEDAFEFVEFAVDPAWQGQGIGGRLHDAIIDTVTERTALLSTAMGHTPAQRMYASRGWIPIVEHLRFHQAGDPWAILGLDIATWRDRRGVPSF